MSQFKLPDLGEGLPDAEINQWHVQVGDVVEADQPMVAMETAKAVVDVPAPYKGTVAQLHGEAGDVIKTGEPLLELTPYNKEKTQTSDTGTVAGTIETSDNIRIEPNYQEQPSPQTFNSLPNYISPAALQLARSLNFDITTIKVKDGQKITVKDIKALASSHSLASINGTPLKGTRRAMASVMTQAHNTIVPVSIFDQAVIASSQDITTQIIHALYSACKAEPALNAWFDGNHQKLMQEIHLGLAVDTAEGLLVPVIKDLNTYIESSESSNLRDKINAIKTQAQARKLKPEELNNPTITLSNFGMFSGRYATPIIVPPQVAILGCGQLHDQVVPINNTPSIAKVLPLSLTFDHRAVTGGEATRFLKKIIEELTPQA